MIIFGLEFRSQRTPKSDITASSKFGPLYNRLQNVKITRHRKEVLNSTK